MKRKFLRLGNEENLHILVQPMNFLIKSLYGTTDQLVLVSDSFKHQY